MEAVCGAVELVIASSWNGEHACLLVYHRDAAVGIDVPETEHLRQQKTAAFLAGRMEAWPAVFAYGEFCKPSDLPAFPQCGIDASETCTVTGSRRRFRRKSYAFSIPAAEFIEGG